MKRRVFCGLMALPFGMMPVLLAQQEPPPDVRKPFALEEPAAAAPPSEPPVLRAEPVEKPAPRAQPVEHPGARSPARGAGVVAPPKALPAPTQALEPDEPGTIRVGPSTVARSPDQQQLEIADNYYAKKMYDMAAPEYERYLGLYPNALDRASALFRLGESYRRNGALNAARNSYELLLGQFQEGDFVGPAAYRLADIYYQAKQFREALVLYRKAAGRLSDPAVANSARFFSGRSLEATGQKTEARNVYEELVATPANNPFRDASRLSLALLLKDAGRSAEALKQIQALAKQAENPELKIEATVRAGLWSLEGTPPATAEAEANFKAALATPDPSRWKEVAQLGLLRVAFEAGRFQEILDTYGKGTLQVSAESRPELLEIVGNAYRQLGKNTEALGMYDLIAKEFPSSPFAGEAQFERLKTLYLTDDPTLLAEIDKYVALPNAPKRDEALLMKAELLFKKQDFANAMPIYSALEISPQLTNTRKADVLFRLGWCQMQLRNIEPAIKAFTSFIDGFPNHKLMPLALMQRGLGNQTLKSLAAASKDYENLIKNFPKARERELALQQRAMILLQKGDLTAMTETYKLLLKDYPKTEARAQADFSIGWAAFDAKNYKEAVPYLEEARELDRAQYFEKCSVRLVQAQFFLEDKTATAKEVDSYAKQGKTKVPIEILRWLSTEFFKTGAYVDAIKELKMIVIRDEVTPADFLLLGRSQHELALYEDAVKSFQTYLQSIKLPSPRASGLLTLAKSQIKLKALDDAQKSVDEALTLQPEGDLNGEGLIVAGDIQIAREHFGDAAKVYESVGVILDSAEITPRALEKAVEAWKAAGAEDKAKKTLNTLKSRYPEYLQRSTQNP